MENFWKEKLNKLLSNTGWQITSLEFDTLVLCQKGTKKVWKRGKVIEKPTYQRKFIRDKKIIQLINLLGMIEWTQQTDKEAFKTTLGKTYELICKKLK